MDKYLRSISYIMKKSKDDRNLKSVFIVDEQYGDDDKVLTYDLAKCKDKTEIFNLHHHHSE